MNKTIENTTEKQRFWWSDVALDIRDHGRTFIPSTGMEVVFHRATKEYVEVQRKNNIMNRIDLIATAKRNTDGAHMCLFSKGNYEYEISVQKNDYSIIESDIFTCDYFDAKSKFEDMAENGILTLPMPPLNNHGIQVVTLISHNILYAKNMYYLLYNYIIVWQNSLYNEIAGDIPSRVKSH